MACILQPLPFSNFEILTEGSEVSTGSGNWKALVLRPSIRIPIKAIQDFKLQPGGKFSVSPSSTKGLFYKGQYRGKKKSICILEIIATAGLWKGKRVTASQKPPKDINPWCEWHKKKKQFGMYRLYLTGMLKSKALFVLGWDLAESKGAAFCSPVQKGWAAGGIWPFYEKTNLSHQFTCNSNLSQQFSYICCIKMIVLIW